MPVNNRRLQLYLPTLSRAGISKNFMQAMRNDLAMWQNDFDDYVARAKRTLVKDVMHPVVEHVNIDDPIGEAIHKLVMYQTLSLVVFDRGKAVGILRLADLFPVIAKNIKRRALAEKS